MLDRDLVVFYQTETRTIKQAVKKPRILSRQSEMFFVK